MKMRTWIVSTVLLFTSVSVAFGRGMSHEEATVRRAYAKLAYAARLGVLAHNIGTLPEKSLLKKPVELQKQLDDELAFQLSNFRVGNLADIADERWDTLVTKPQGDVVMVTPTDSPYTIRTATGESKTTMFYATTNWSQWNFDKDWNIPVHQVMAETPTPKGTVYTRYAAYTVTVTLHERSRIYLAMFWFGRNAEGKEALYPIDHILGMGTLTTFLERSIYPQSLLETHRRELPGIRDWIKTAGTTSCTAKVPDVCCNAASGKCGIPEEYLQKSLKIKIDPTTRALSPQAGLGAPAPLTTQTDCLAYNWTTTFTPSAFDTTDHSAGNHSVSASSGGTCTYLSGGSQYCNSQCKVAVGGTTQTETGKTSSLNCHVVGLGWADGDSAGVNAGTGCTGNLGGGCS